MWEVVLTVVGLLTGALLGYKVGKIMWMKRPLWVCVTHVSRDGIVYLSWQDIRPEIKQGARYTIYRKDGASVLPKLVAVVSKPEYQDCSIEMNRWYWYCVVGGTVPAKSFWMGSFSSWTPVIRRTNS